MKKPFVILLVFLIILCFLCSCGGKSAYARELEAKEEAIYQRGYDAGYDEGYRAAMSKAPDKIDFYVEEDLWELNHDIEDKWGMSPEEAIQIIANYADDPEALEAEELNRAIWAIYRYYYDSYEVINSIEDYWID